MNTNLLNIIKRIVAEQGEAVLGDAEALKPLLKDYAKDEPQEERLAFGRCVQLGCYQKLKNAGDAAERKRKKAVLMDVLHAKAGIEKMLCANALDLLEAVIFDTAAAEKKAANTSLLDIVKRIIFEKGQDVLADPQTLKMAFKDYAQDVPKEERLAFGRCIEMGCYEELKNTGAVAERKRKKATLADQVHAKTGIDKALCAAALDLIEAVIFAATAASEKQAQDETPAVPAQNKTEEIPPPTIMEHLGNFISWLTKRDIDKEVAGLTKRYEKTQGNNLAVLSSAEYLYKVEDEFFTETYGMMPEEYLELLIEEVEAPKEKRTGFFGFLANAFSAGEGRKEAERQYGEMVHIYEHYDSFCQISLANVTLANARYNFACGKAILYVQQMKDLIESFTDKQKNQFDQTGQLELEQIAFSGIKAEELFKSIQSFNKEYDISTKAMWNDTFDFAADMICDKDSGKLGKAFGVGAIAVAGVANFFDNVSKEREIEARLIEGIMEIRTAITQSKANQQKADAFVIRAEELTDYLEEAIDRYTVMFSGITEQLFPKGDASKSKLHRKRRQKSGEGYYTNDEMLLIMPLGKYAKTLKQITEAKF